MSGCFKSCLENYEGGEIGSGVDVCDSDLWVNWVWGCMDWSSMEDLGESDKKI